MNCNTEIRQFCGESKDSPQLKSVNGALAGVVQWIEHWPANQRLSSSIPSQGTCLGCRPGPQWRMHERQPQIDVSLPLFLPPFPSLKVNK